MTQIEALRSLDFGQSVAEQETDNLHHYFVKTTQWQSLFEGKIDIIYGAKGSGKSALYALINNYEDDLFNRNVLLRFAENPRGATAFNDLNTAPPSTEMEFINIWKLYILSLLGEHFAKYGVSTTEGKLVISTLRDSGLLLVNSPLSSFLTRVRNYIKNISTLHPLSQQFNSTSKQGSFQAPQLKSHFTTQTPLNQTKESYQYLNY